jgi:preprotein translocase subunit SecY
MNRRRPPEFQGATELPVALAALLLIWMCVFFTCLSVMPEKVAEGRNLRTNPEKVQGFPKTASSKPTVSSCFASQER